MELNRNQSRKDFLKQSATGLLAMTGLLSSVTTLQSFKTKDGNDKFGKRSSSLTAKEFQEGIMPRAQLSKAACEIILPKTKHDGVKQFAGWELMEATTVIKVLRDNGTPGSSLSPEATRFLEKLSSSSGKDLDKAFMQAQLSNHEYLRDLATSFIEGYDKHTTGKQEIGHVSNLALFAFTEHVGLCQNILAEL